MDKSFNDQELSDIMKEIEALEDDFKIEEEKFEASAPEAVEETVEPVMEMTSGPVVERPAPVIQIAAAAPTPASAPKPLVATAAPAPQPVHHHHTPGAGTSMSFKVSGDINLQLEFDVGGKIVSLAVTETGLSIQMEGGMTFSVPLKKAA